VSDEERKNLLEGLGELDWDSALDEWEKKAFSPEPPKAEPAKAEPAKAEPAIPKIQHEEGNEEQTRVALSSEAAMLARPEGTMIAPVPRELREEASRPSVTPRETARGLGAPPSSSKVPAAPSARPSAPGSTRGGLGQLFMKGPSSSPRLEPDRPSETMRFERRQAERESETLIRSGAKPPRSGPSQILEPEEKTALLTKRKSISDAITETRLPADDEMPTLGRPSMPPRRSLAPEEPSAFLDGRTRSQFLRRIEWLEEEARVTADDTVRGRALLALSELSALASEPEHALAYAVEARDTAPSLALAWRQARQLMPNDPDVLVEALDAEAASSEAPSARAHATLLAADVLRMNGNGDAAVERWDSACKLDPADVRAPIARAALALAQSDHTNRALSVTGNSELVVLDRAIATALRLRGVERASSEHEEMPINDGLRHARGAIATGDVIAAANAIAEIAAVTEIATGASWLSASFGAAHIGSRRASARALKTLTGDGDPLARRALAARGIELGDPELVLQALRAGADQGTFTLAERATLQLLAGKDGDVGDALSLPWNEEPTLRPLEEAIAAIAKPATGDEAIARAHRTSGSRIRKAETTLGRLLGARAPDAVIDELLAGIGAARPPTTAGVALESAVRAKRWQDVSDAIAALPSSGDAARDGQRHVAAALVAERAGDAERTKRAWAEAVRASPPFDGLVRIAAELDPEIDLGRALLQIASEMPDDAASSILRLEAVARGAAPEQESELLERIHHGAPTLGIGSFLAERLARRRGDLDEVIRWIQERKSADPLEGALDAVREALLVADRDSELASSRLEEAHRERPDDAALRELYERLAADPPADRAAWREKRAASAPAATARVLWLEAALEHERLGDQEGVLRVGRKAQEAGDHGLASLLVDRAELAMGDAIRQTDELLERTKTLEDPAAQREAFERLATIDAYARHDRAAATMWHRSILEIDPKYKPSLRWLEQTYLGEGRDDELVSVFEQIALALAGTGGAELSAHAQSAARFRSREISTRDVNASDRLGTLWERTYPWAKLAADQPVPSLWSLRAMNAHARVRRDDGAVLGTTTALLDRTQRPAERAALLLRASEAAERLERLDQAREFLERAAEQDPGDVVTWGFLAELRERGGDPRAAAEACESLARTSVVPEHQLLAWHDAAKIWLDDVREGDRAIAALEAAAEIDPSHADIFPRLSAIYAERGLDAELARLLEKRLATVHDEDERVALEVELAHAFAEMGELRKAKTALQNALDIRPSHTSALATMGELCSKEGDWTGAEQAYVRLARLLPDPAEQRAIYERLGEIYAGHAPNLSRAEVAYKEVKKRAPGEIPVLEKLVDVYRRQGDLANAVDTQQEIVGLLVDPDARLQGLIELAKIYETIGRDPRRAEQVLDAARKEYPTSVVALRSLAEFYARHRQMPAMQILLDRAAADARRAFAQGRFVPSLFEVLHAAFELRGKRDAARVVAATLAAVEGQNADLPGAEARAVDPRLDELLAPELMSPALRALLFRSGDALDVVAPSDLRALRATPLPPGTAIGATIGSIATFVGLGALMILISPQLGRVALPLASNPATLLIGEGLAQEKNQRACLFVVARALKMLLSHASALIRVPPPEVAPLVAGLFNVFNPSYVPPGVDPRRVQEYARRIGPALPKNLDPTVGVIALEAAGMLAPHWPVLANGAIGWANRVALLAVGDPNAALDAIAWDKNEGAVPTDPEDRAAWIARNAEARELMTFSVTDAYAEARIRLALEK
jgi:cellulose synthase operon protein C